MIEQDSSSMQNQISSAIQMLLCPENNSVAFVCVSSKCKQHLNPFLCNTESCKSCTKSKSRENQTVCKRQKLVRIYSYLDKILKKRQQMPQKQKKCVENTLGYLDQIIQLISHYRQNFENMSNYYGLSLQQFYLIQGLKTSDISWFNHQYSKRLYNQMKTYSYFSFLDISQTIGKKIFDDIKNQFAYYFNQSLDYSFTKVPFTQNLSYKFKNGVLMNVVQKLDRNAKSFQFNAQLSNQIFQKITSEFSQIQKIKLKSSNLMTHQNIIKLSNLKNLKQLIIQKDYNAKPKPSKSIKKYLGMGFLNQDQQQQYKFSKDLMKQILKIPQINKVKYQRDFQGPDSQFLFSNYFINHCSFNLGTNQLYSDQLENPKTYWIQNLGIKINICQNLKSLCLYSSPHPYIIKNYFGKKNIQLQKFISFANIKCKFLRKSDQILVEFIEFEKICFILNNQILKTIGQNMCQLKQLQINSKYFIQNEVNLVFLKDLIKLQSLSLFFYSQIHDNLKTFNKSYLAKLKRLKCLNLIYYQNFNNEWLQNIKELTQLQALYLSFSNRWSASGFKQFKNFQNLKTLVLYQGFYENQYLTHQEAIGISTFRRLKNLYIDKPVQKIQINIIGNRCKSLVNLVLNNAPSQKESKSKLFYQQKFRSSILNNYHNDDDDDNDQQQSLKDYYFSLCYLKKLKSLVLFHSIENEEFQATLKSSGVQIKVRPSQKYMQFPLKENERLRIKKEKQLQQQRKRLEQLQRAEKIRKLNQQRRKINQQRERQAKQQREKYNSLLRLKFSNFK